MADENKNELTVTLQVKEGVKDKVNRKYAEFCVAHGKVLNLMQFNAILLTTALNMSVAEIKAVSEAAGEDA